LISELSGLAARIVARATARTSARETTMPISVEHNPPVTTVLIDRPEARNAVNQEMAAALAQAFRAFDADEEALVAVFAGMGGTFCAGYDLKAAAKGELNRLAMEGDGPMGPTRLLLGKPVIAAISGYAVGGGFELALWCDLRVAEEDAVLGLFNRRWGVPQIDGASVRLPALIGLGRALDLILTGRPVGAQEALEMGLVNRVVRQGQGRQAAEALARELARFPRACLRHDRLATYEGLELPFTQAMENEVRHGLASLAAGSAEGARRFAEGAGRHGDFGTESPQR
jgi:enoyl-CoA hydratase